MRSTRLLALTLGTAAALTACGTPTVTTSPDTAAQEAAISKPSAAESSATPAKKKAGVGDIITLTGSEETLKVSVKVAKVITKGAPANDMVKADAGKRLYGVELVLKVTGTATYDDSPSNGAKVIDDEGQEYDASLFGEIAGTHKLNATTIAPGDVRKGTLVFEVPTNAKITRFQFALNSGFADQKGVWAVN
ncbi:DUF4352 domain-containing protein [Streptosporangium jomthongense]|uniref:DUF4352 domain-containing protein n=1 Tax=Streptosporangium jomthongense TaxID=1193683 RepID=A0ABV8FCM4_9ACTN